jgi:predicted Zn-dependent protease
MKLPTRSFPVLFILLGVLGCASMGGGSLLDTAMNVAGDPDKRAAVQQTVEAVQTASQEITPEQEYYIGRAVAANILAARKAYSEQVATGYVNVLGRSLSLYSDRPETFGGYHFLIMDTDEINAFAAPGGLILISRGLLRCADSEETVAAILAHEISHVVLKHGLKAISNARWTAAVQAGANATVQVAGSPELKQLTGAFKDSINDITNTLVNSGYSREQELEADQMALVIMRKAGYEPQAFDDMLGVMKSKLKAGGADFAKTHPDPKVRMTAVEKTLKGQPAVSVAGSAENTRQARYKAALGAI